MTYLEASRNRNENGWIEFNGHFLAEIGRQEYTGNNCIFASGFVAEETADPPCDTMYLVVEKAGQEVTMIMVRPDEMAAIAWLASGILWSELIAKVSDHAPR